MTDAVKSLFELLTKKEKSGSDYTGTVTRVDGKTAYVRFSGAEIADTPVSLSIGAKAGDSVRIRVADGRAWIIGNDTAPPNDSSEVAHGLAQTNAGLTATATQLNGLSQSYAVFNNVVTQELTAHQAVIDDLNVTYANITLANIDTANINTAKIKDLFTEVGLIRDAVISDAKITGYLDAVKINAASIDAGTLSVDRLVIRGDNTSLVYAINNISGALQSQNVNTINGEVLTDRTILADKIVAHSITANEITANNIVGTGGWINLAQGTFNYGNALVWDGSLLTVSGTITSTNGSIGGWTISTNGLAKTVTYTTDGSDGQYTVGETARRSLMLTVTDRWPEIRATDSGNDKNLIIRNNRILLSEERDYADIIPGEIRVSETSIVTDATYSSITPRRIYEAGTALTYKYMGFQSANGYYGMTVAGHNDVYVRTTTLGLIPYQSGGSGTLGTSAWPFNNIHGKTIYENGTALGSKYLAIRPVSIEFNPPATAGHGGYIDFHYNGSTEDCTSRIIEYASGYLLVSGHLQTGSEIVARSGSIIAANGHVRADGTGDVHVYARNTATQCYTSCRSEANGNHGIYSPGYWNGSAFVSSGRYLIYRSYPSGNTCMQSELYTYNEGYTSLRPVVGTNAGTNAVGVVVSNASSFGIYGRWGGGATAAMSGRTISCPSSDIRLKENIEDSTVDALSVINAIRIRQFDWKDKSRGHWNCGMIVDEMERDIDPNFCIGGGDDGEGHESYKSVNTFYLQGYEVKAIQELSKRIEELERRLAS